ncbi:MAG: pyrroline-5-carboxylate reductase [Nitratireductor sp.]|nr:pyrroline-5-carboxylate reductase [Nitratireductor sp.]
MAGSFDLCLCGAGNMGGAMLAGWLESGFPAERVTVIDPGPRGAMAELIAASGIRHATSAPEGYRADVLMIAVKPQLMEVVLPGLAAVTSGETVCVSVAAGTTIARIAGHLGDVPIVRCMPNTPALLRRGITACCPNGRVSTAMRERVDTLLRAIGKTEWVDDERLIDAVTAVSGSGPAYVFHLAECMAAAGMVEGLPEALANALARETIAGAGEMLSQLPESAAELRSNVTSPNGTTQAALEKLTEDEAMAKLFARAIHAARMRSEELSG